MAVFDPAANGLEFTHYGKQKASLGHAASGMTRQRCTFARQPRRTPSRSENIVFSRLILLPG